MRGRLHDSSSRVDADVAPSKSSPTRQSLPFALICFVSALLLFLVQPLLGKFILPWFGGTPAVWTTAMLFFQTLLLGGYLYAHVCTTLKHRGKGRTVLAMHLALVALSLLFLPIIPPEHFRPKSADAPLGLILGLLLRTVGLPYFLLAATGPLVQTWCTERGGSPYRLYAVSNAGSLLALLGYPFLLEPLLSVTSQARLWSVGFVLLLPLWLWGALLGQRKANAPGRGTGVTTAAVGTAQSPPAPPDRIDQMMTILLPALACGFLLSTTNHLSEDVAVIPLLWVIPLALYLVSFILTFESDRLYRRQLFAGLSLGLLALLLVSETFPALLGPVLRRYAYARTLALSLGLLFSLCMLCHGEIAARRPAAQFLTGYYLRISLGGVLGGIGLAVVSPLLLSHSTEWYGTLLLAYLLAIILRMLTEKTLVARVRSLLPVAIATAGLVIGQRLSHKSHPNVTLATVRNFYGEVQVHERAASRPDEHDRVMFHGGTIHGVQYQHPAYRRDPVTYYDEASGIGLALAHHGKSPNLHVGVIGLGIGTLATYARSGQRFRFYELNPAVERLARQYFSYLSDCQGQVSVVLGDARLSLEQEPPQSFDLLVLDAFSGDAIPTHLLTQEALQIYARHLRPDGTIAVHITNRYLDLAPVVRGMAAGKYSVLRVRSPQDDPHEIYAADWMLLTQNQVFIDALHGQTSPLGLRPPVRWTDESSPILSLLLR